MRRSVLTIVLLCGATLAQARIPYLGGPIMNTDPAGAKIYIIWYGNWSAHPDAMPIAEAFHRGYAATERFAINRLYPDASGVAVPAKLQWGGHIYDAYLSAGPAIPQFTGAGIILEAAFAAGIPRDTNAIYAIWLGHGVSMGWNCGCRANHSYYTDAFGNRLKYNMVNHYSMDGQHGWHPTFPGIPDGGPYYLNDEPVTMATLEVAVHELDDTLVDPEINAWYSPTRPYEFSDPCNMDYPQPWPAVAPNGVPYNVRVGDRYFILQSRWFNFQSGGCIMSVPADVNFTPNGTSSGMRGEARLSGGAKIR